MQLKRDINLCETVIRKQEFTQIIPFYCWCNASTKKKVFRKLVWKNFMSHMCVRWGEQGVSSTKVSWRIKLHHIVQTKFKIKKHVSFAWSYILKLWEPNWWLNSRTKRNFELLQRNYGPGECLKLNSQLRARLKYEAAEDGREAFKSRCMTAAKWGSVALGT